MQAPPYTPPSKDVLSPVPSLSALYPDPAHPAHSALLRDLDLNRDSVRVYSFAQGGITVCPDEVRNSSRSGEEQQETFAKASGYLQIISTSHKLVPRICIKLVADQTLNFSQGVTRLLEEAETIKKEVVLRNVWLNRGQNTFEFALSIPHDTSVNEDGTDATLHHFMIGTVVGGSRGMFGVKDLVAREKVWVLPVPSLAYDSEQFNLAVHVVGITDDLGPCTLDASSSRFTVAGPMFISLTLHSPPPTLKVLAIKCFIEQKTHLTSLRDPSKTTTVVSKCSFVEAGWAGPYGAKSLSKLLEEGRPDQAVLFDASRPIGAGGDGTWTFERAGRMPTDLILRPSTHPKTRTCIRRSSELVVDLYLTSSEPSETPTKVLIACILRKPVFLLSCGCLPDRLSLPDYAQQAEAFVPIVFRVPCFCDVPTDELLTAELQLVRESRARGVETQSDPETTDASVLLGRKVGEAY